MVAMTVAKLCALVVGCVGALSTLEDALANVTSQVTKKFGNFTLSLGKQSEKRCVTMIEALVCKNHFCQQKATDTMKTMSDASYMRAVYGHGIQTSPNIEAQVNLSSLEDNPSATWPPISQLTFEAAFARIRSHMDVAVEQATFRRPLHPCVSEDLFQFELIPDIGEPKILSVLGVEVRKQKEFLNGDAFQRHIEETCQKALESYVRKEVMFTEVQRSTEQMCNPLHELIDALKKELKDLAEDCKCKDGYIHQCLENTEIRLQQKDENLSERINTVMDELPEKATVVTVDDLRGRLLYHVDTLESFHMRLQKETTHKVQEVVTRLSEFQVILQEPQGRFRVLTPGEEILHRGTKYDIAVLTDRVDKCALKDKIDGDEIREQLSWQSTKIESMQFQNGLSLQRSSTRRFGPGMKSRNLSRSSSVASDAMGLGRTLSLKNTLRQADSSDLGSVKFTEEEVKAQKSNGERLFLDTSCDTDSSLSKEKNVERVDTGNTISILLHEPEKAESEEAQADPLENLMGMNGGSELQDHLIEQQEQLQMLQEQLAEMQQASFMSGSTLTEVVQQQLEFLSQGVFCLGRVCLRPRKEHASGANLLSHLHSVMHWIIHRQRPAEWDPTALTTIALASGASGGEDVGHSSPPPVSRQDSEKGRASLRRAKAASASQPKPTPERSNSPEDNFFTRRQFAMGGPGWQQRGIPASGTYDEKRPKTSGAVLGSLVAGGNVPDGKRILVSTPGVAEVTNLEHMKADEAVSLPPLTGEPLSARGSFKGHDSLETCMATAKTMAKRGTCRCWVALLLLQVISHFGLDFAKRGMPRRPKSWNRAPAKSLRLPADKGCCSFRVKRHWRWRQMIEEPLGVYEFCNSTGLPRFHAIFASAPGEEEFLGCFKTQRDAAVAWDRRARRAEWPVLNFPVDGEEEMQLYCHCNTMQYLGQEQLQDLLMLNVTDVWRSQLLLQLEDLQRSPGDELCWSFHPHSFAVSKTKGANKKMGPVKKPSALETFSSNAGLMKSLRTCLERCGDPTCSPETLRGECKFHDDSMIFQGGGSWIANFPATAIYQRFAPGGVVYDACAGWGGRLLGARLGGELSDLLSPELEDFDVEEEVDVAFTSPPYFNTELYSNERTQSHVRFPTAWRNGFLQPMLAKMVKALRPGGHLILSVTTRRVHRRSGLDARLTSTRHFNTCTPNRFALYAATTDVCKHFMTRHVPRPKRLLWRCVVCLVFGASCVFIFPRSSSSAIPRPARKKVLEPFAFEVDESDHCETPGVAYKHIAFLLREIAQEKFQEPWRLASKKIQIYDPHHHSWNHLTQL
eukprot:s2477_g3.t1